MKKGVQEKRLGILRNVVLGLFALEKQNGFGIIEY